MELETELHTEPIFETISLTRARYVSVVAVITARNEEKILPETISLLKEQTLCLKRIVVVNDGSTDKTGEIAKSLGCTVIDLPHHKESFVGRPELAERLNAGLNVAILGNPLPDYVLIVGADHPLPPNYVEELVSRMESNAKLVVASGRIEGEPYTESAPRGSGRLVKTSFWKQISNVLYPIAWGWESWLLMKATQLGYETKCFKDLTTELKRPTRLGKAGYWGKAMYALGYDWKYSLGRCSLTFLKSPRAGLKMFWGWFRHKNVERLDTADWVNQLQKKQLWSRVWQIIKHGGRK